MQIQAGIVNCSLPACEPAIDRNRSRKIRSITAVIRAKVHQDKVAVLTFCAVTNVVEYTRIVAARNNASIGFTGGLLTKERMYNFCLNFIFHYPGADKFQQATESR